MERNIKFRHLDVEITRKCNFRCAHCMRGEAQNVDLSEDNMRRLLEQTDCIEKLVFTGGEPLLNFGGMIKFMTMMTEMNIDLYRLEILTNGSFCHENIVNFLNATSDYIEICLKSRNRKVDECILFAISEDIYHKDIFDASKAVEYYKKAFADNSRITVESTHMGNVAFKYGRALLLKNAFEMQRNPPLQCEIMTNDKLPAYPLKDKYKLDKGYQKYILSPIYYSAYGDVINKDSMRHEYSSIDTANESKICTSENNDNILECIGKYNQGKMHVLPWVLGTYARRKSKDYKVKNSDYSDERMKLLNSVSDEVEERAKYMAIDKYDVGEMLNKWILYKQIYHEDEFGRYCE